MTIPHASVLNAFRDFISVLKSTVHQSSVENHLAPSLLELLSIDKYWFRRKQEDCKPLAPKRYAYTRCLETTSDIGHVRYGIQFRQNTNRINDQNIEDSKMTTPPQTTGRPFPKFSTLKNSFSINLVKQQSTSIHHESTPRLTLLILYGLYPRCFLPTRILDSSLTNEENDLSREVAARDNTLSNLVSPAYSA